MSPAETELRSTKRPACVATAIIVVAGCLLLPLGGCGKDAKPATNDASQASQPLAGLKFRLAVVDDWRIAAAAQRMRGEWKAQTGSEFDVVQRSEKDLVDAKTKKLDADGVIFPSAMLGTLAEAKLLAPLPEKLLRDSSSQWSDIFEMLRLHEAVWGNQVLAVPFGSPVLTCCYRADLLEKLGRGPPQSWEEYQDLAQQLDRLKPADGGGPWHGALEPLEDDWAGLMLRAVNGLIGLAHCWLALLCLRLLFPANPGAQAAGLLVAAFLPPHLYLSQYVTNEPLAGFFVTIALYLCLRALRAEPDSFFLPLGIGAALGAAMLTKSSALLALPFFPAALALRLRLRGIRAPRCWLRSIGVLVLSCLVVCGWHYVRVSARFGAPIVGNWDPEAGFAWWQDPGFRTSGFYSSWGQVPLSPLLSASRGFADGIYATLWGDGLISGAERLACRPPWNYDLISAAYLLALGLSLLGVAGFARASARCIRRLAPEWFLVIGLTTAFGLGVLYMSLRVPSYAQDKAFYAFPALVPFSALVALGWDWLQRKHHAVCAALWLLLLVWSMTVCSAFWVRSADPQTHQLRGICLARSQRDAEAIASLSHALQLNPGLAEARNFLGEVFLRQGKLAEATNQFAAALQAQPDDAQIYYNLGDALLRDQRTTEAIGEFRKALDLRPDWPEVLNNLAWLFATHPSAAVRDGAQAVPLAERACHLTGQRNISLLSTLAAAYAETGRFGEAVSTQQKVCELAAAQGKTAQVESCRDRLALYRAGQPYHRP